MKRLHRQLRPALLAVLTLLPLLLLWPALRHVIESRMSLHMLVEFPALFASGWCAKRLLDRQLESAQAMRTAGRFEDEPRLSVQARSACDGRLRLLALLDWRGWTGATFASCVAVLWMVPMALDAGLLSAPVAAAKYASWWLAGCILAGSWRRMDPEVLMFFAGNMAWMAASAGMLYVDAPARLCVNYLQDDQRHAGIGLVFLALVLGALALRTAVRPETPVSRMRSVSD